MMGGDGKYIYIYIIKGGGQKKYIYIYYDISYIIDNI